MPLGTRQSPAAISGWPLSPPSHILLSAVPPPPAPDVGRRLVPVLEDALAKIEKGDEGGLDRLSLVNALALLGVCHEALGNPQAALASYTRALQADPCDHALLLARGVLQYGSSPRAITDLELAIQYASPTFLPYFLLAHHYLVTQRFEDCLAMCDQASRKQPSAAIHSELAEWTAVAQAELGFPPDSVRASLEKAIRLDPSNDRARRNLDQFETARRSAHATSWETRSATAVRTSGQAERQFAMAA
jgi:tetratricopeptide (TPR) repeat protein